VANRSVAAFGALSAALLLAGALAPSANAAPPERFEVLQSVVHPLDTLGWTRQGLTERCVLVEQHVTAGTAPEADARAAVDALLDNTTRRQLAYAEYGGSESRFADYYRSTFTPTAIFDGLGWVAGGGPQGLLHAQAAYDEASRVLPQASINVSSSTVITTGHLDFEVFVPADLTGYTGAVRAVLVEDNVTSAEAGRPLRYLVRESLGGGAFAFEGNATLEGRLNFTLDPSWVVSRLYAVMFVQIDAPPAHPLGTPPPSYDLVGAILVPIAVLVTGATMAVIFVRYVTAERKARLR
jgi:hypothetical protein